MQSKFYCRKCKGLRKHKAVCEKKTAGDDGLRWKEDYYIIECLGCETLSFLKVYGDESMMEYDDEGTSEYVTEDTIFPPHLNSGVEIEHLYQLPDQIRRIYVETLSTFKAGAFILSAAGFRAIIEAICNELKIKKDTLSKRIDLLSDKGFLTSKESKRLHSIRFMGNDALHEMETPKENQLVVLLEITNHLLENLFIQDKKLEGTIDTLIDNYEDFLKHLNRCINSENVGKRLTLSAILGKSIRLVKDKEIKDFEEQLSKDIQSNKLDFLETETVEDKNYYTVKKRPPYSFNLF
jgi:hypothetical protein